MIEHQLYNTYDNYNAYIYTDTAYQSHFHKNYELIYIIEGAMAVSIDNYTVNLNQGELILISPFTIHSFEADKNVRVWVGVFAEAYIHSFAKKTNHMQYSKFYCSKSIDKFLNEHLFFQGTPDIYMAKSCLYMICGECLQNATIETSNPKLNFKQMVIEFIYEKISEEITLRDAAQILGYEYHYFSSLFHACFNINFKEFVNIFRYEYASEMLMDKTKDISSIAGECGFQSIRNFNRVFKKLSGKSPSEYRKNLS